MDSKALTDLGLEELKVNASPALTDYMIVIDPNTKEPKLALLSNQIVPGAVVAGATITVGAEAANVVNVAIQLTDADGDDIEAIASVQMYLSSDAAGVTLEGNGPTSWAIGTDGILIPDGGDSVISGTLVSEADGDIDINMTKASADTMYMNIILPNGNIVTSDVITFDADT